jgi:hypothetical protein
MSSREVSQSPRRGRWSSCAPALGLALICAGALPGCTDGKDSLGKKRNNPGSDFVGDTTVRVTSPAHGSAVDAEFVMEIVAGDGLTSVSIETDGQPYTTAAIAEDGPLLVTMELDAGYHEIAVHGIDASDAVASTHELAVEVVDGAPWVTITSPRDGSTVSNPARFTVNAAADVDQIELLADGYPLGTVAPDQVLTYSFTGVDYPRAIEAVGYLDGVEVATHSITVTVTEGGDAVESDFNALVMDELEVYPTDGSYTYWWPDDVDWGGNPHDIYYLGELFAEGDPYNRSFCVGMTFQVFMEAVAIADAETGGDGSVNGILLDELYDFRTDWYVRDLYGSGVVEAVENYGIGEEVRAWEDVRPGDFIQFWRHSGSGHNAIFIDWERDSADNITGFTYWSTQSSTDGVGYNAEYFGSSGSRVDPSFFFVARVAMPWDWIPWR